MGAPVLACVVSAAPIDRSFVAAALATARPGDYAVYWSAPHADETWLGLGALRVVRADGAGRFGAVREQLAEILTGPVIGAAPGAPAVRPRALGGFAFAPERADDPRWSSFASAELAVHRTVYGVSGTRGWILRSTLVSPGADVDAEARRLAVPAPPEPRLHAFGLRLEQVHTDAAEAFVARARQAIDAIREGRLRKVVVARSATYRVVGTIDPAGTVARMHAAYPECSIFWFGTPRSGAFIGATPERLLRHRAGALDTMALAGSAARGASAEDDERRVQALRDSEKDRAEHAYVVAAIRDTLDEVARDVRVADEPEVLRLANIAHLRTPIHATVDDPAQAFAALEALHPTPAVGGVPRQQARAFLDATEGSSRGWYAGPVGWIDAAGDFDFAVGLRSAMIRDDGVELFAGAGIVEGSRAEQELAETELKMDAMRRVLGDVAG